MSESTNPYAEAAKVACPRCGAKVGAPCWESYCNNGYQDCRYAVCNRVRDMDAPHAARLARAAVATPATTGADS